MSAAALDCGAAREAVKTAESHNPAAHVPANRIDDLFIRVPTLSIAHLDAGGDRAGRTDEENGSHKRSNEVKRN